MSPKGSKPAGRPRRRSDSPGTCHSRYRVPNSVHGTRKFADRQRYRRRRRLSESGRTSCDDIARVRSSFCLQRYAAGALCALLLLSGSSWPTSASDAKPLTAIPPYCARRPARFQFRGLGCARDEPRSRPGRHHHRQAVQIPVSRLFPDLKRLAHVRDKVYFGGPLDFGAV